MTVIPSHAPSDGLPNVAAITMARDEGRMLPRWVEHYTRELGGPQNVFVVDDNSVDGSTDGLPCAVLRIPPITKKAFEPARMGTVSGLGQALLESYDAVLFTDADEFVIADPAQHESLRHFVAAREGRDVAGVVGLNVVHRVGVEAPLDLTKPFLGQRRVAKFMPLMCKPSLKWVAAPWAKASHGIYTPFEVDPELWMFHMKFADRDHLKAAADHRRAMVDMDGRAATTNWQVGGDDMVALLDKIAGEVPPLDQMQPWRVPTQRLERIVQPYGDGIFRATGLKQTAAMEKRPFVKIPHRFLGRV
jgi:hypothetical protein